MSGRRLQFRLDLVLKAASQGAKFLGGKGPRLVERQVDRGQDQILEHLTIYISQNVLGDLHRLALLVAGHTTVTAPPPAIAVTVCSANWVGASASWC
jgi:hypothetical protein